VKAYLQDLNKSMLPPKLSKEDSNKDTQAPLFS
jgi:hypothetical protein